MHDPAVRFPTAQTAMAVFLWFEVQYSTFPRLAKQVRSNGGNRQMQIGTQNTMHQHSGNKFCFRTNIYNNSGDLTVTPLRQDQNPKTLNLLTQTLNPLTLNPLTPEPQTQA